MRRGQKLYSVGMKLEMYFLLGLFFFCTAQCYFFGGVGVSLGHIIFLQHSALKLAKDESTYSSI